ncbi:MAG: hypothetical protein F6K32_03915 [Desertifilum sp. SIO1I2]|nr:hypothetical protein [Desertifilum sp. SIO1I2]
MHADIKSHAGISYAISEKYMIHPWTGDRYFAGYQVDFLPSDGSPAVVVGFAKTSKLAECKAKECIDRFGDEFF